MSPQVLTIHATALKRIVDHVLPFAGSDVYLPVLNAVLVQREGDWITAVATDRYRLAISRVERFAGEEDETTDAFTALIPRASLSRLFSLFKVTRRSGDPLLRLTVSDHSVVVERAGGIFDLTEARIGLPLVDGEFPKYRGFANAFDQERKPVSDLLLNPSFLADFQHARTHRRESVRLWGTDQKGRMLLASVGDHFLAVQMRVEPARGEEATTELDASWRPLLGLDAEKPKAEAVA